MIVKRVEKTNYHLKLFTFDSIKGDLCVTVLDDMINYSSEALVDCLKKKNLLCNDDRIIINQQIDDAYSAPFKLYIDITDKCPLDCKHCLTKELNNGYELSYEILRDIADECHQLGILFIKLGGGEPLFHENFEDILKLFSEGGQYISLSTNGYSVDRNKAKLLAKYNVKVTVSLEGPREINDFIRGNGHFDTAIKALHVLQEQGVNTCLRVTLTKQLLKIEYFEELIEIAKNNNTKLKISYCRPAGSSIDNMCLVDYSDLRMYYNIIKFLNQDKLKNIVLLDEGMMLQQPLSLKDIIYDGRICGCVNRSMHINSRGYMSPCVFLGKDYICPMPYKKGSISKYWGGEIDNKVKNIRNIPLPQSCTDCSRLCKYECLATRIYFNNDVNEADPNCLRYRRVSK